MSRYHYVVTAQKPTVVSHAITGHFTSPTDRNLITAYVLSYGHSSYPAAGHVSAVSLIRLIL
jgi:hypothetical protein